MTSTSLLVRPLAQSDRAWVRSHLEQTWGSTLVARKGEVIDASAFPGFLATVDGTNIGLLMAAQRDDEYEVVSISVAIPRQGIGRALMERSVDDARSLNCRRVWLTTTNNNVAAFGFYQSLGMDLRAFYRHGVTRSRLVKPTIPHHDAAGLPIDHELEFELMLG